MFSETMRSRVDCASSPDAAMRSEVCSGSSVMRFPAERRADGWRADSLPPCGGGQGRGVGPYFSACSQAKGKSEKTARPPTPARPHKGGGRARAEARAEPSDTPSLDRQEQARME